MSKTFKLAVTQLTTASKGENVNGTAKITFRGKVMLRGKERERTFVAQGKAADLIAGMVRKNRTMDLICKFDRAPSNDNGRGGEYVTIVALPSAKKAA